MGPLLGSQALAPQGQFLSSVTMCLGGVARSDDNYKGLAPSELPLKNAVRETAVERTTEPGRNEPRPPLQSVCAESPREQYYYHPMGHMFHPELDKVSLISTISEILEQPGFTNGPSDQRRLLRDVKTGRIDVRNMSRLLRWLGGEKGASLLRRRGVTFVGPTGGAGIHPYTSGLGMSRLVEMVEVNHPRGTQFVVCFSSSFDACSGIVAGKLVSPSSISLSKAIPGSSSTTSVNSRRIGKNTRYGDEHRVLGSTRLSPSACSLSDDLNRGSVGDRPKPSGSSRFDSRLGGATSSVALLFDEKPKHYCTGGDASCLIKPSQEGVMRDDGGAVAAMGVSEWVAAYGECDGPMLAAWVFPMREVLEE